jgi:selenophosphate synthetase-related protein
LTDFLRQPRPIPSHRDILLFQFENNQVMVIGSEASGGVGPKQFDKVKVDGYTVGRFSARVALMEVLSVGAIPFCLVDTLSVEMNPTGKEIINGVVSSAVEAGLDPELAITGGTEKNFRTVQTGVEVTVIGFVKKDLLRIGTSQLGDVIVAVGLPCVGSEVLEGDKEGIIADIHDLLKLLEFDFVHEIISVGSEGIAHEIEVLAKSSNLNVKIDSHSSIDFMKSAGPASVVLFTLPKSKLNDVRKEIKKPIRVLGQLA